MMKMMKMTTTAPCPRSMKRKRRLAPCRPQNRMTWSGRRRKTTRPNGHQVPSYSMPQGRGRRTSLLGRQRWIALPRVGSPNNMLARTCLMPTRHRRGREGQPQRFIARWRLGIPRILLFHCFLMRICCGSDILCTLPHQAATYPPGGGAIEGRCHAGDPAVVGWCHARLEREQCRDGHGAVWASLADNDDGVHSGTSGAVGAVRRHD
jgi:hypothetical protein